MPVKKLPKFLIFTLLTWIAKGFIFKYFRKPKPDNQLLMIAKEAGNEQTEYSLKSDYLWVAAPECSKDYKIEYAERVFYQNEEHTNRVKPVIKPEMLGFFTAYPGGLHINQNTGEIDVNASDTGICYTVEFTPCGQDCGVTTEVVISGIWYKSRIFSLSTSPPEEFKAKPFYNGSPGTQPPSGKYGISNNKCPEKNPLNGLIIDHKTGVIDLKQTIESGALGFRKKDGESCDTIPENGTSKDFKVYYRLDDKSDRTLNEIYIRIHFYNTKEDIPYELRRRIEQQNNSFSSRPVSIYKNILPFLLVTSFTAFPDSLSGIVAALVAALSSLLFLKARGSDNPCSPSEHCGTK